MSRALAAAAPRTSSLSALLGRIDGPAVAAWTLAFALVVYLGLEGGGYDEIVRGQAGVAIWWIVALGALAGVLPAARIGPAGWAGLGLLGAFALWTGLSTTWTESTESTVSELGRAATYAGVLALALALAGRTSARHMVNGVAAAIGVVAAVAVLSRLQPQLFPANVLPEFFNESIARRLSYPVGYWNGLAMLVAMGTPLMLRAAADARSLLMQGLAAAAVPVMALAVFLTVSRGGALVFAIAVAAWLVLSPNRLPKAATALTAAGGAALLLAGAGQRDELQSGLVTAAAREQGDQLLAMAIVVCAGVALIQIALGLVGRHVERPRWSVVPRPAAAVGAAVAVAVALVVALAAGAPSWADAQWQQFKEPLSAEAAAADDPFARLSSTSGSGRYEHWQQAVDMHATAPLRGNGAGTFEYWWARNHEFDGGFFVRDAHSLYFETLAELGYVGLALIGGLLVLALAAGVGRSLGRLPREHRGAIAAATAGLLAFAVAASVEWAWELGALTSAALVLAAVILAGGRRHPSPDGPSRGPRIAFGAVAVIGLVAVVIPLAGASAVRGSEGHVRDGDLASGLRDARAAAAVQPYRASAHLQEALVFERAGALGRAAEAARVATVQDPANWRTWLVRSRIDAARGEPEASVRSYREARRLNPTSPIFREP